MYKKNFPILFFMCLFLSSLFAGHYSFRQVQNTITEDLNQALFQTFLNNRDSLVSQDTIKAYKELQHLSGTHVVLTITDETYNKYLKHKELKAEAYVSFALAHPKTSTLDKYSENNWSLSSYRFQSDTLVIADEKLGETIVLKGISKPTLATILQIADLRISLVLAISSFLWLLIVHLFYHKKVGLNCSLVDMKALATDSNLVFEGSEATDGLSITVKNIFGDMSYIKEQDVFFDIHHQPIHFTPMQQQLMRMFWEAPSHTLSKDKICNVLWPKKEDASETLYTLVKRIKPILEDKTNLKLTVNRGKSYTLEIK